MKREEVLLRTIKIAESKLKDAPAGNLVVRKTAGHTRYYLKAEGKPSREVYLGKKGEHTIKALQEKYYYTKLKKAAERTCCTCKDKKN